MQLVQFTQIALFSDFTVHSVDCHGYTRGNIFWNGLYCSSFLHSNNIALYFEKKPTTDTQTTKLEDKWTHVLLFGKLLINVAQIEHTNDAGHSHRIQLPCAILTACS